MSKVTGPLLSFDASGTIAKTQVYSKWRGISYVRRHVVPANPQTAAQQDTRNTFRTLQQMWTFLGALSVAPWNLQATGQSYTGRNKFTGTNVRLLRGQPDMTAFQGSPGAKGGLPPAAMTAQATANPGEIQVTFTQPQAPVGWTLHSVVAMAFPDQSPQDPFSGTIVEGQDDTTQTNVLLQGLPSGELCVVSGWTWWKRPDQTDAYGASITATATPL